MIVAASHLGLRRSRLLGTNPSYAELVFALSIFTWWPFKPRAPREVEAQLAAVRNLIAGLASTIDFRILSTLDRLVSDDTLRLSTEQLYARQQLSVMAFLTAPPEEAAGPAVVS